MESGRSFCQSLDSMTTDCEALSEKHIRTYVHVKNPVASIQCMEPREHNGTRTVAVCLRAHAQCISMYIHIMYQYVHTYI